MTVKVETARSVPRCVNAGAPQGSVLGTYIFNVGTDGLEEELELAEQDIQYQVDVGDLAFLEMQSEEAYAESTPERVRFPSQHPEVSPITGNQSQQLVHFLPTARNIPNYQRSRRIEPTWRDKPVGVRKFVDDNLQTEKLSMKEVNQYEQGGQIYRNVRARKSEAMFRHISANAENQGLKVNTDKTTLLPVSGAVSYQARAHMYDRTNTRIDCSDKLKALGFTFNRYGDISDQVENLCKKYRSRTWALRDLRKSGFTREELIKVYKSTIRPVIEYSSVIYHPMLTGEQTDYIEKQQSRALKNIYGNELSHRKLLEISGLPTLKQRREEACKKFASKTAQNPRFSHHFRMRANRSRARDDFSYLESPARTNRRFNSPFYYYRRILNQNTTRYATSQQQNVT